MQIFFNNAPVLKGYKTDIDLYEVCLDMKKEALIIQADKAMEWHSKLVLLANNLKKISKLSSEILELKKIH